MEYMLFNSRLDKMLTKLDKIIDLLEKQNSKEIDWYPAVSASSEYKNQDYNVDPNFTNNDTSIASSSSEFSPATYKDILYRE